MTNHLPGMRLAGISSYAPRQVWSNAKVTARLRLARMQRDAQLRRERGTGLTPDEAREFGTSDRWVRRFIGFTERRFSEPATKSENAESRAGSWPWAWP